MKMTFAEYYTEQKVASLKAAFARVQDRRHWKNPIDAIVVTSSDIVGELNTVVESIEFYHGTCKKDVRVDHVSGKTFRVRSDGYSA